MAEIQSASHLPEDGVTRGVSKRESDPSERRNYKDRIYELQGGCELRLVDQVSHRTFVHMGPLFALDSWEKRSSNTDVIVASRDKVYGCI